MSFLFFFQGISVDLDLCETFHRITSFITHYQDHKVYGDSFFEYVVEDYLENNSKSEEHHNNSDNENLPVHSHHQCCHPVVFLVKINTTQTNRLKIEEKEQFHLRTVNFNSRYLESIFQPPQV